jgi:hypothetical protein
MSNKIKTEIAILSSQLSKMEIDLNDDIINFNQFESPIIIAKNWQVIWIKKECYSSGGVYNISFPELTKIDASTRGKIPNIIKTISEILNEYKSLQVNLGKDLLNNKLEETQSNLLNVIANLKNELIGKETIEKELADIVLKESQLKEELESEKLLKAQEDKEKHSKQIIVDFEEKIGNEHKLEIGNLIKQKELAIKNGKANKSFPMFIFKILMVFSAISAFVLIWFLNNTNLMHVFGETAPVFIYGIMSTFFGLSPIIAAFTKNKRNIDKSTVVVSFELFLSFVIAQGYLVDTEYGYLLGLLIAGFYSVAIRNNLKIILEVFGGVPNKSGDDQQAYNQNLIERAFNWG